MKTGVNLPILLGRKIRVQEKKQKKTRTECLDQRNGGKQCITLSRVGRGREHNVMNRLASQD
jgi:hypothetical protein